MKRRNGSDARWKEVSRPPQSIDCVEKKTKLDLQVDSYVKKINMYQYVNKKFIDSSSDCIYTLLV